jgi:hypothetical protein
MDFIQAGANITHLKKDEISHELVIRGCRVNPESRRSSLQQVLIQTADLAQKGGVKLGLSGNFDSSVEISIVQRKVEEIEKALQIGPSPSAKARLLSRCKYFLCRVSRLQTDNEDVQLLRVTLSAIMDRLQAVSGSDSDDDDSDVSSHDVTAKVIKKVIYKTEKQFNINTLNLKYNGNSCARLFLRRLEELRVARQISEPSIFRGFPEILDGPALSWFRSKREQFTSYTDVVTALRDDFDIPDLDFKLLQEIRSRTQARDESIVSFVSVVLGMFERLNKKVPEEERLDILTRNIRPDYSRELALQDVTSISQLTSLCKRIELAKVKADQFREPSSSKPNTGSFNHKMGAEPKFASRSNLEKSPAFYTNSKSYVASVGTAASKQACFRCGMTNHVTSRCKKSREVICFKCGEKGVRTPECPTCSIQPKNGIA